LHHRRRRSEQRRLERAAAHHHPRRAVRPPRAPGGEERSRHHRNRHREHTTRAVTCDSKIKNPYPPTPPMFNVVAEIRGTDKADEIVMLGAHFDSWHASTGASDNAAGSAGKVGAVRVLQRT